MAQQTEANDEMRLSDIPEKHRNQLKREQCHQLIGYMESNDCEEGIEIVEQFIENWLQAHTHCILSLGAVPASICRG